MFNSIIIFNVMSYVYMSILLVVLVIKYVMFNFYANFLDT